MQDHLVDEDLLFSREEYVAAHSFIMSRQEAERFVDEVFCGKPADAGNRPTHLSEDTLDLLSLVSEDCAERVRQINGDNKSAAIARRERFRRRIGAATG
jgi:hypothetical protein